MTQDQSDPNNNSSSVTGHLREWKDGDPAAAGIVISELYTELRRMSARMFSSERAGHTLQPTALVGELYLRLASGSTPDWRGRTHFFAVAAGNLRRILIEHARANRTARRGGGQVRIPLDLVEAGVTCSCDDLLIIDEALVRLEEADPRAARVTELRFFGGLTEEEIAKELEVAEITVKRDWKFARAWLAAHLRQKAQNSE